MDVDSSMLLIDQIVLEKTQMLQSQRGSGYVMYREIAARSGNVCEKTVERSIARLEATGKLSRPRGGRRRGYHYQFPEV